MKKVVLIVLVILILMQFIKTEKNVSGDFSNDISMEFTVPNEVKKIMENSCNDCHSNFTNYPWYGSIAPMSWYVAQHVTEGKEHLNFSEWMLYNKNQKKHILKDLEEVLESREMPLTSYLFIHRDAVLTQEEYELFYNWLETLEVE